jgi:hypothetical protein
MIGFDHIIQFVTGVVGIVLALPVIAGLVWLVRRLGWPGPVELVDAIAHAFQVGASKKGPPVNVELQDASGEVMDLAHYVEVTMQNGEGNLYRMHAGIFAGCEPEWIRAGANVRLRYQDGLVKETVPVQYDHARKLLFVKSAYRLGEIVAAINTNRLAEQPA